MANLLRVNFFNALEGFGWCISCAGTSRNPGDVLQGIQTDIVVEYEGDQGSGEYANFLMTQKGRLTSALLRKSCLQYRLVALEHTSGPSLIT